MRGGNAHALEDRESLIIDAVFLSVFLFRSLLEWSTCRL